MSVTFKPSDPVDFLVIGAGAAGGVMAKELSTAGFSVVVLEQGPYLTEKDYRHDEIRYTYQAGLTNDTKVQPITFRKNESEQAKPVKAIMYGRQVGGGSVHFTANYWRFHESDFEERSQFGEVPGSGLADWPIKYADLEPYYTKAEYDLGISGLGGANPFEGPRSKPYPLPPMPMKSSGVLFDRATKKLGLHPYPAPMAILSQAYQGRAACVNCGFCEYFGCEVRAKSSTLVSVIPTAENSGKCEIRPNSYVRKIETDASGRATGAVYFDANRREIFQRAKAVVLCANGAETARLLLISKSKRFPDGLANSSGLVGKYLMWDTGGLAMGLFEHPLNEYKGIQVTRVIHDYYRADPKRGFYGGAGLDARFNYYPANFALQGMPPDAPKWGAEYKKMLSTYFTHTMTVLAHISSLPQLRNSISLDPNLKDAWGLPAMRVTFDFHPDDVKTLHWALTKQVEILEAAGAKKTWTSGSTLAENMPSTHLMGTCRMGNDPKQSVVNRNNRTHDVPNLFIADGSSFVTAARQQPTATIQALSYRAADLAIQAAKRGELGS
jgi:choline dehydrogenase-like flavoprotein